MIYPSVENNRRSCNFAIHPLFVDNYIRLESVSHVKVLNSEGNKPELEFIKLGKCENRSLVKWYAYDLDLDKVNCYIEYIACTKSGRVIWNNDLKNFKYKFKDTYVEVHKYVSFEIKKELNRILDKSRIRDRDFKEMMIITHFSNLRDFKLIENNMAHDPIFAKIKICIPLIYNEL